MLIWVNSLKIFFKRKLILLLHRDLVPILVRIFLKKFNMHASRIDFLQHILNEANFCFKRAMDLKYEEFIRDEVLSRAVIRALKSLVKHQNKFILILKQNI